MTGQPRLTVAGLREAVRKRVEETSLRAVADEIGMSFSGLRSFVDGGAPQRRTIEKLVTWHSRAERSDVPQGDVETALALVRSYVGDESKPRSVRERRLREVIDRLKDETR